MNQFLASIISLFMAAVHFEHGIITPIALSMAYAIAPHIKYNTQIAVGVYSLVYLYRFDSLLLLSFVEVVKGAAVVNFIRQHRCNTIMNLLGVLGMSGIAYKWYYRHIILLYMFGLGTGMWLASFLDSELVFYVTIYLYQLVLYKI